MLFMTYKYFLNRRRQSLQRESNLRTPVCEANALHLTPQQTDSTILQQLGKNVICTRSFVEFQPIDRNCDLRNRKGLGRSASVGLVSPVNLTSFLALTCSAVSSGHSAICSFTISRILPCWCFKGGMCGLKFVSLLIDA